MRLNVVRKINDLLQERHPGPARGMPADGAYNFRSLAEDPFRNLRAGTGMQQFQLLLLQAVQRNLPLAAQGKLVFEIQPLCAVMEQSGAAGLIHVRPQRTASRMASCSVPSTWGMRR